MLIDRDDCCLIVFNMQSELIPMLNEAVELVHACTWLSDLFATLGLPVLLTEHKKLGTLLPALQHAAPQATILEKQHFSLHKDKDILSFLSSIKKKQLIFAGAESHICLLQSAFHLRSLGHDIFLVQDAISSRNSIDHLAAETRLRSLGFTFITREMLFFELLDHSEQPDYRGLSLKFLDGRYINSQGARA